MNGRFLTDETKVEDVRKRGIFMQRNLRLFIRAFLVCAIVGCTTDFLFNGFQFIVSDVVFDFIMDLILALITVYICGEVEQQMDVNDAMKFLRDNSLYVIENENTVIGVLSKYRQFFMGNLQYDKARGVIIGPKIVVKDKRG